MREFRHCRSNLYAAAVAALGAAVLVHPGAAAARPKAAPDRVYAGQTDQGLPAFVKLGNTRIPTVTVVVAWDSDCTDGSHALLWDGAGDLRVKRGRFAFRRAETADGPQVTMTGTLGKTAASGTWEAKISVRDDQGNVTAVCDSGLVRWKLPRSGYGGQTSAEGYPMALTFDKKKTKVTHVLFVTPLQCQSGPALLVRAYSDFLLTRAGAFGDEWDDPSPSEHTTYHIAFHGRLGRSKATGSWRITAVVQDAQGNQVDSCDSGPITWNAAM